MFSSSSTSIFATRQDYVANQKTYSFLIVEDVTNLCTYFSWFKKDNVGLTIIIPEGSNPTLRDIMAKLYCSYDDAYVIADYLKNTADIPISKT